MRSGLWAVALLLGLAGGGFARTADAEEARVWKTQTRGFDWFFANVKKPELPCNGEMIVATWYDTGTHTASGKAFDPNGHTAAHRTLPFGTKILITNPHTSKSLLVTINDRGPFTKGVILDLARGAARAIGMKSTQWVCMADAELK